MLQVFSRITVHNFVIKKIQYDNLSCPFFVQIGQFQKISIRNHGGLPCFNPPPLAFGNSKMRYPPCPQNSIIVNLPSPSEFPFCIGSTFST